MKIKINKELEIKHISCFFEIEYWDDSTIDGKRDDLDNPRMPCIDPGDIWHLEIDPKAGRILNWPQGHRARIKYYVRDACVIRFATDDGMQEYNGYVPHFLDTYGDGFGDYLHFDITEDGLIEEWCNYSDEFDMTGLED